MFLVSTSSLAGYGLHKAFKLIKEAGYHGVDLVIDHDNYDTWDKDYLKSLFIEFNLPIVSITAPSQKLNEEKVNIILEIAQTVEAKSITFAPPHISDKNIKWFKTMLPSLKPEGIDIVVQNVPPKFLFFIIPEYKNSTLDQIKKITGNTALDVLGIDASS
jgi:sugar phosphate isomerase/epimerase